MNKGINTSGRGEHVGIATSAIAAYRLVKFGTTAQDLVQVTGAADSFVGVSTCGAAAAADTTIVTHGEALIEASGAVTAGSYVKADASGRVVTDASPTMGVTVGKALSGVQVEKGVNVVLVRLI